MNRNVSKKERLRALALFSHLLLFIPGCSVVDARTAADAPNYYFGLIKLSAATQGSSKNIPASSTVQSWGIRLKDALTIGYARERAVRAPMDCRILFFIHTAQQMEQARQLLKEFKEDQLCVIQSQG